MSLLFLVACGMPMWGDNLIDTCGELVRSETGFDDVVLDGTSGAEAMALFAEPIALEATWFDERDVGLTLEGAAVGDTVRVVTFPDATSDACNEQIEIDVALHLTSADGALDERWESRIQWSRPFDDVDIPGQIPVADVGGTLDWAALAPDAQELIIWLRVGVEDVGYVELATPTPDSETGSELERLRIAEWDER